jgi:serine/threonine protein phosphatase PrpC
VGAPAPDTSTRPLRAAGASHPGRVREGNEDRVHVDPERGILLVVDGVGGHAAGEVAAAVAVSLLRARLERPTGRAAERVREAIALANNEIAHLSERNPAWEGMACVLTVVVVEDGLATVGHVGDTRLYKLRGGGMEKVTHDHSPIGVREDAGELSESQAMAHPRRNEVYRTVGAEPHQPEDEGFVELLQIPFEPDAALLLCTDGLTDLVPAAEIARLVEREGSDPRGVVDALVRAANDAGGKDNVSVAFAAGPRLGSPAPAPAAWPAAATPPAPTFWEGIARSALVVLLLAGAAAGGAWLHRELTRHAPDPAVGQTSGPRVLQVGPDDPFASIAAAMEAARPGDTVLVGPGTYREPVRLAEGVTLRSARSREAVLSVRGEAAVRAEGVRGAVLSGFRLAAAPEEPFDAGVVVEGGAVLLEDLEVTGARRVGVELSGPGESALRGSAVHGNLGPGVLVRAGASPRLAHNLVTRNGRGPGAMAPGIDVEAGAAPTLVGNVVAENGAEGVRGLSAAAAAETLERNAFEVRGRGNRRGPIGVRP